MPDDPEIPRDPLIDPDNADPTPGMVVLLLVWISFLLMVGVVALLYFIFR